MSDLVRIHIVGFLTLRLIIMLSRDTGNTENVRWGVVLHGPCSYIAICILCGTNRLSNEYFHCSYGNDFNARKKTDNIKSHLLKTTFTYMLMKYKNRYLCSRPSRYCVKQGCCRPRNTTFDWAVWMLTEKWPLIDCAVYINILWAKTVVGMVWYSSKCFRSLAYNLFLMLSELKQEYT